MLFAYYATDEHLKSMSLIPVEHSSLKQPMLPRSDPPSKNSKNLAEKIFNRNSQVIPQSSKIPLTQRNSFSIWQSFFSSKITTQLNKWVQEGESSENRTCARDRILEFLSIKNIVLRYWNRPNAYILDLSNLGIKTLPPFIFELPAFRTKLRSLDLSDNKFTELPSGIGLCSSLESLFLNGNRLKKLPQGKVVPKVKTKKHHLNRMLFLKKCMD